MITLPVGPTIVAAVAFATTSATTMTVAVAATLAVAAADGECMPSGPLSCAGAETV